MVISAFGHRCHTNKATDFNHIGQYGVLCAVQFFHAFNRQKVGSYTADPGTHAASASGTVVAGKARRQRCK